MGLFSDVANILEAPGKRKAAKSAAAWQQAGLGDYIDKISGVQANNDAMYAPYVQSGHGAVSAEDDLAGLNGNDAQDAAIGRLQGSPLFESLMRNGQNTLLANASATGGLRGGNIQNSLANFGKDTLAQVIQQQLSTLGGLSSQGLSATNTISAQDNDTANTVGNLLSGIAQSKGGLALATNAINNQQYDGIASLAGNVVGAILGVPGLGGTSGGSGMDWTALLSQAGQTANGQGSTDWGSAQLPTDAQNPFTISGDTSQALGSYQRSQGGGISNTISNFLSRLQF